MENNRSTEIKEFEIELDNLMIDNDNIKELGEYIHKLSGILLSKTILMNESYDYSNDNKNYQRLLSETKKLSKLIITAQDRVARLDAHYSNNKYEITDIVGYRFKKKVYRIRALKNFGDVKKGDLGGYVSSYENLSQYGDCWIYDDAAVIQDATLENNSTIHNTSIMYGTSTAIRNSKIYKSTRICGNSIISDSTISGKSLLKDTRIYNSRIKGNIITYDTSSLINYSNIRGILYLSNSSITNSKIVSNIAWIDAQTSVYQSNLKLFRDSNIDNSSIGFCENIYGDLILRNTNITDSKIIGNKNNRIAITNKKIINGCIRNTKDVISLDIAINGYDNLCYYRGEDDKIRKSFNYFSTTSLEELIQHVSKYLQNSFTEDYIELLRQFDKIAQKHFNTN